jgi:hypothetical protein
MVARASLTLLGACEVDYQIPDKTWDNWVTYRKPIRARKTKARKFSMIAPSCPIR